MLLAIISHQPANNQANDLQDSVTFSQVISDESSDGHVCMSEDGRITGGLEPAFSMRRILLQESSYQYIVNHCEVGRDENGGGVHHDYLMVMSKGKVLFKQEIEK